MKDIQDFSELSPDDILTALEQNGYSPTGQFIQLNSFENRVFDVFLEDKERIIIKFFRPGKWNKAALQEEQVFLNELMTNDVSVSLPLKLKNGTGLGFFRGVGFSIFKKAVGRALEELSPEDLTRIGRMMGRMHNIGKQSQVKHRPPFFDESFFDPFMNSIQSVIIPDLLSDYEAVAQDIVDYLADILDPRDFFRIHGDLHKGNVMVVEKPERHFVLIDFDDFTSGPAEQDLWMFLNPENFDADLDVLLEGYNEFRELDVPSRATLEALRGYRILRYAYWITSRWKDPSFPQLFPQFHTYNYWAEELQTLKGISHQLG